MEGDTRAALTMAVKVNFFSIILSFLLLIREMDKRPFISMHDEDS